MRLHFHAGILLAPFLLVAAVTGLAYTAMPQVERLVHREHLQVPVGDRAVSLGEQVAAARRTHPEGTVAAIRPPETDVGTTRVVLEVAGLEEGYSRTVFVDPYRAEVVGALTTYGEWLPVRAWFDELHRTLHLGETGRLYSELAASWLWVIVLAGTYLWVARRRRLRRGANPAGRPPGRRRLARLHGGTGIAIAIGLLFLSATGLTWSQHAGDNITELREQLSWQTPQVEAAASAEAGHEGHGGHTGREDTVDDVDAGAVPRTVASARARGLDGPIELTPSQEAGAAWTVRQTKRSWPEQQDAVAVEPATGRITDELRFADWPVAAKLARWGIDAHIGLLFGVANQLVLAVIAIGLIAMILLGYRMWWRRRPAAAPGSTEGTRWWDLPIWVLVPATVLGTVVGLLVPLLGITLLALIMVDTAIVLLGSRRRVA